MITKLIAAVTLAAALAVTCPIDDSNAYFTGTTRIDGATGRLLYEYKCGLGHSFWLRA